MPQEQIALYPHSLVREFTNDDGSKESFRVTRRDEARMMVLHRSTGEIEMFKKDKKGRPIEGQYLEFRDILDYFDEGDTFVMNDTKVFPARLYGTKEKTDAKIEVFVLRELNEETHLWDVLVEPARKIRIGNKLFTNGEGEAWGIRKDIMPDSVPDDFYDLVAIALAYYASVRLSPDTNTRNAIYYLYQDRRDELMDHYLQAERRHGYQDSIC